jgi:hypothetical protein
MVGNDIFNVDIICRYIDKREFEKYDMKCVVEQNDRTMLLAAEPGKGKIKFLPIWHIKSRKGNL